MATCYRHPNRETGVSCSNCGRPICPDCMTSTAVGMRCPECSRQRTQVRTLRATSEVPVLTRALIAVNVVAYLAEIGSGPGGLGTSPSGSVFVHGALFGPAVQLDHEYWRLVTGAFLHASIIHILFNMYILWWLGNLLEPAIGSVRFGAVYLVSLLAGSMGALILTPDTATVGASGAIFGLLGAGAVEMRSRGIGVMESGFGMMIVLNLGLSFALSNISVGGHVGGLIGGALAGVALRLADARRSAALMYALMGALAVAFAAGGVLAAQSSV